MGANFREEALVNRFSIKSVTLDRIDYNFADHYFGTLFPPPGERDEARKIKGVLSGENDGLSETDPIWRVDYVQRQLGYFNFIPMISQRSINESGLTAALINARVDFSSFDLKPPSDPEITLREYFKVYTGDPRDDRIDLSMLWSDFYACLEPLITSEFSKGNRLIPTIAFLEELRSGNLDFPRFTGFKERDDCNYDKPRFDKKSLDAADTAFMFVSKGSGNSK